MEAVARRAPAVVALLPSIALGQADAAGPTGVPLLWMSVGIAAALLAITFVLLFSRGRRRRSA